MPNKWDRGDIKKEEIKILEEHKAGIEEFLKKELSEKVRLNAEKKLKEINNKISLITDKPLARENEKPEEIESYSRDYPEHSKKQIAEPKKELSLRPLKNKYLYPEEKLSGIVGAVINDDGSLMIHTDDERMFGNIKNSYPEYKGLGALFNIERIRNLEKFGKVSVVESLNEGESFIKIEGLKTDVERDEEGRVANKEDFQKILNNDREFCREALKKESVLMLEPKSKINTLEIKPEELNGNKYLNIDYSSYFLKKPGELTDIFQNSIGYMHDRDSRQIKILADEDNLQKLEEISRSKGIKMNYKIAGKGGEKAEERGKEGQEGQKRDDSGKKKDNGNNKKKSNPNSLANVWRMAEGDEISRAIAGMMHHVADTMHAAKQKDLGNAGLKQNEGQNQLTQGQGR